MSSRLSLPPGMEYLSRGLPPARPLSLPLGRFSTSAASAASAAMGGEEAAELARAEAFRLKLLAKGKGKGAKPKSSTKSKYTTIAPGGGGAGGAATEVVPLRKTIKKQIKATYAEAPELSTEKLLSRGGLNKNELATVYWKMMEKLGNPVPITTVKKMPVEDIRGAIRTILGDNPEYEKYVAKEVKGSTKRKISQETRKELKKISTEECQALAEQKMETEIFPMLENAYMKGHSFAIYIHFQEAAPPAEEKGEEGKGRKRRKKGQDDKGKRFKELWVARIVSAPSRKGFNINLIQYVPASPGVPSILMSRAIPRLIKIEQVTRLVEQEESEEDKCEILFVGQVPLPEIYTYDATIEITDQGLVETLSNPFPI
jgi:hypothetical protein